MHVVLVDEIKSNIKLCFINSKVKDTALKMDT